MEAGKDYIFINYSRDDLPKVAPIVEEMRNSGYNVWYDANIQPGKEWPDYIASHIKNCAVCVAFHSQTSRDSPHCREEIHYALKHEKTVISVYLEDVTLKEGLDMQLARLHSVRYTDPAALLEMLRKSSDFERCGENAPVKPPVWKVIVKKIAAALKKAPRFVFRVFSLIGFVFLLVIIFAAFAFYKQQMPIGILGDKSGVLEIICLPSSETKMTNYSYKPDDFNPPSWAAKTPLVQCAVIRKGITHIGASAFANCFNMKFVFIPESVTSIGDYAFFRCAGLKELEVPHGVTDIGQWAFSGCAGLKSVSFSSGITNISPYVFSECRALKQVEFPEGIQVIHGWSFANCIALEEITIPDSIDSSCRIWPYAFLGCSNLKTIRTQYAPERVQIVQEDDWFKKPSSNLPTLYICATAFDSNPEIIFEPPNGDEDVVEYVLGSDYEGGLFYENQ